nr:hypothetical protein [Tanacetum cinerariifolium]
TCTLQDDALTWWNSHVKTTTPEAAHAITWATLKKMTDKYCPRGEIKKIEAEIWNLKEIVTGNFTQDLSLYVPSAITIMKRICHLTKDCRSRPANNNNRNNNNQGGNGPNPRGNGCFECGNPRHFKRDCRKLKNKNGGNGNAQGWVYAM